jgi:methylated-DNA-[protein]-cysteine S-methyltransferase
MTIEVGDIESPIGRIVVAVRDGQLCALEFAGRRPSLRARLVKRFGPVEIRSVRDPGGVVGRLRAYLGGNLRALDGVAVDAGGTEFQRAVWREMRKVPPGQTISYGDLARRAGAPRAVRAVGGASGANPVGIVIPCHRVIARDGGLHGYGGGLDRKRWLLRHEGALH